MRTLILTGPESEDQKAVSRALKQAFTARGDSCLVVGALALLGQHVAFSQARAMEQEALLTPRAFAFLSAGSAFLRANKRKSLVYEVNAKYAEHLSTLLREGEFDAVLCLHRYPAEAVSFLRKTITFSARCCYLSCDYACVPFLEETRLDHYLIPHEELASAYEKRGIPAKKIVPAGIPAPSDWFSAEEKADARALLNLPQTTPCILVPFAEDAASAVSAILSQMKGDEARICVLAPDGAPPKSPFVARFAGDVRVTVLAPEDPLSRYLAACDVILTLPSGAATAFAAVIGKPLVHLPSSDPWQRQTAQFFSARGLSLAGADEAESASLALSLAKDETQKDAMRERMQLSRIQSAAPRVVRFLHEGRL
jgi:processive 1,2-diacylglycerol beta-glucosyltransferase